MAFDLPTLEADSDYAEKHYNEGVQRQWGTYNPTTGTWSGGSQEANVGQREKEIGEEIPGAERASQKRAQHGGLLNSGIQGGRETSLANRFSNRRLANQKFLTEGRSNALFGKKGEEGQIAQQRHQNQQGYKNWQEEQARLNPPLAPTYPGQSFPTPPGTVSPRPGVIEGPGFRVGETRGPSPRELEVKRAAEERTKRGRR